MTKRQRQMFDFIRGYWKERGYSPSYREIADGVGIRSISGVSRMLICLQERGLVTFLPHKARSIFVTEEIS